MLRRYTMPFVAVAAALMLAPAVFANESKYETRQVWNGRGFVTNYVLKDAEPAARPYALTGKNMLPKKNVQHETLRIGSRIVATYRVDAK